MTVENKEDLERVQKAAVRIILGKEFTNYESALDKVDLEKLEDRRENLCLKFAKNCLKHTKTKEMFPERNKIHSMGIRNPEKYEVAHANTERLKDSAIPYMQRLLNKNEEKTRKRTPG